MRGRKGGELASSKVSIRIFAAQGKWRADGSAHRPASIPLDALYSLTRPWSSGHPDCAVDQPW